MRAIFHIVVVADPRNPRQCWPSGSWQSRCPMRVSESSNYSQNYLCGKSFDPHSRIGCGSVTAPTATHSKLSARSIMNLHKEAKLNHLSFPTTNVAETAAFFEKYLGCEIVAVGQSCPLKPNGFDNVLDHVTEEVPAWPKNFHSEWRSTAWMTSIPSTRNSSKVACAWKRRFSTTRADRGSFAVRRVAC